LQVLYSFLKEISGHIPLILYISKDNHAIKTQQKNDTGFIPYNHAGGKHEQANKTPFIEKSRVFILADG